MHSAFNVHFYFFYFFLRNRQPWLFQINDQTEDEPSSKKKSTNRSALVLLPVCGEASHGEGGHGGHSVVVVLWVPSQTLSLGMHVGLIHCVGHCPQRPPVLTWIERERNREQEWERWREREGKREWERFFLGGGVGFHVASVASTVFEMCELYSIKQYCSYSNTCLCVVGIKDQYGHFNSAYHKNTHYATFTCHQSHLQNKLDLYNILSCMCDSDISINQYGFILLIFSSSFRLGHACVSWHMAEGK